MDWAQMACHRCLVYLGDLCKNPNLSFFSVLGYRTGSNCSCWYHPLRDWRAGGAVWPLITFPLQSVYSVSFFSLFVHESKRMVNTRRRKMSLHFKKVRVITWFHWWVRKILIWCLSPLEFSLHGFLEELQLDLREDLPAWNMFLRMEKYSLALWPLGL